MGRAVLSVLACLLVVAPASGQEASETGEEGAGSTWLQQMMGTAGEAVKGAIEERVEDELDEWAGTYKGRITELELVERRGNALVLDVSYRDIKRADGVYIQGEVLSGGMPLEGFSSDLSAVHGRSGLMRMTLSYEAGAGDEGWGVEVSETQSDQLRLSLVRETHPDRPFGSLTYDLSKTWTMSDEPDVPEAEEEAIALAEDEELEGAAAPDKAPEKVFVPVGTVLRPVQVSPAKPAAAPSRVAGRPAAKPKTPAPVDSSNLYAQARLATWQSRSAKRLPFPGTTDDRRGFVRTFARAKLSTGNAARRVLQTHPDRRSRGWIRGVYPPLTMSVPMQFRAVAGFLQGTKASDGATFSVFVKEDKRMRRVIRKHVKPDQYVNLQADLSRWVGKRMQLVLQVDAGASGVQDRAVWVSPRLERK